MPRRLLTPVFWHGPGGKKLLAAAFVCGALLVAAVIVRSFDVRSFDRAVCAKVDRLAEAQLGGLNRGLVTLPTLAYYKQHPLELQAARRAIRQQIKAIRAASC